MAIKLVSDVGAPAAVFAADWATSAYDEKAEAGATKLNRPVGIALALAGYAGALFGWGGDFVKNIGIASFDWAANSVVGYIRERSATPVTRRAETRIPVHSRPSAQRPSTIGASARVMTPGGEEVIASVT